MEDHNRGVRGYEGMNEKRNLKLMKAVKAVHSMVGKDSIDKQRQSQDNIGSLFTSNKELQYTSVMIGDIAAEWVSVNRHHMGKNIILYCHGGGFFTGSLKYARSLTSKLASITSMDVLSFDYGLAPENPYPCAIEDTIKIWDYLMLLGYGSRDIIVAGDSAGGNLALGLALNLKEEGRRLPRGLVLMSPFTDLTLRRETHQTKAELDPVLDKQYLDFAVNAYAKGQDLENPHISPLYANLAGLPPIYIQVGDNEVLLDDSIALHKKLIKSNVFSKIDIYKGMWHVFQMSPFKKAYAAMDEIAEFIYTICR